MEVRLLRGGEEDRWSTFVEGAADSVLGHRIEWRDVFSESFGHKPRFLIAEGEEGAIRGILPLMRVDGALSGRALVSLPWIDAAGPLAGDEETAVALLRGATALGAEEKCRYVEIRALQRHPEPEPVRRHKVLLVLPLREVDAVWKGFAAKVRNQVRKGEREGLVAEIVGEEGIHDFYRVFSRNMRDIGVPVWGRSFFRSIVQRLGATARVILVRHEGRPVGGAIWLRHGITAVVPCASSLRSHFALCPNHLLYWTAIRTACEAGCEAFDFGRSTPGSGTYRFKRQWGSDERPCYWHYALLRGGEMPDLRTENKKMRALVGAWKHLPLPVANLIGPRIVRRIP